MAASVHGWTVDQSAPLETAFDVLSEDRIGNGYALADLESPFDQFVRVAVARRGNATAACMVLRHPEFTAIVTHGDADGLDAILAAIDLPSSVQFGLRPHHLPVWQRYFTSPGPKEMARMAVTAETFRLPGQRATQPVRLAAGDAEAMLDLYAGYEESFFSPSQIGGGVFYGVREGGRLLAAAGTHIVALRAGIAAVG